VAVDMDPDLVAEIDSDWIVSIDPCAVAAIDSDGSLSGAMEIVSGLMGAARTKAVSLDVEAAADSDGVPALNLDRSSRIGWWLSTRMECRGLGHGSSDRPGCDEGNRCRSGHDSRRRTTRREWRWLGWVGGDRLLDSSTI
jgi:hypothetical protein